MVELTFLYFGIRIGHVVNFLPLSHYFLPLYCSTSNSHALYKENYRNEKLE
jgi:hypothetical protein